MSWLSDVVSGVGNFVGGFLSSPITGTLLTLGSTYLAYKDTKAGGDAAQQTGEYNARIEGFNTEQELYALDRYVDRLTAAQQVGYSASGVRAVSGSALHVLAETLREGAVSEYYIAEGGRLREQARRFEGDVAEDTADTQARNELLRGITNLAGVYR